MISENFELRQLTKELVEHYQVDICKALDQIPLVDPHTLDDLLMKKKGDRILYKKWDHSFILLDGDKFVGIVVGYERDAEDNEQYPFNSIYMNDLAVSSDYQKKGLGRFLVGEWLKMNTEIGFLELGGDLQFSVQTNSAEFNLHVQKLYESFGFRKIAEKQYDNRTDNVYFMMP